MKRLSSIIFLTISMLYSLSFASVNSDINMLISKYGKSQVINYIVKNRESMITIYVDGVTKEMSGPPSEEFVNVNTIKRDLAILKITPERVKVDLEKLNPPAPSTSKLPQGFVLDSKQQNIQQEQKTLTPFQGKLDSETSTSTDYQWIIYGCFVLAVIIISGTYLYRYLKKRRVEITETKRVKTTEEPQSFITTSAKNTNPKSESAIAFLHHSEFKDQGKRVANFACPVCHKAGSIDDARVPEEGIYATCPMCKARFILKQQPINDLMLEDVEAIVNDTPSNSLSARKAKGKNWSYAVIGIVVIISLAQILMGNIPPSILMTFATEGTATSIMFYFIVWSTVGKVKGEKLKLSALMHFVSIFSTALLTGSLRFISISIWGGKVVANPTGLPQILFFMICPAISAIIVLNLFKRNN